MPKPIRPLAGTSVVSIKPKLKVVTPPTTKPIAKVPTPVPEKAPKPLRKPRIDQHLDHLKDMTEYLIQGLCHSVDYSRKTNSHVAFRVSCRQRPAPEPKVFVLEDVSVEMTKRQTEAITTPPVTDLDEPMVFDEPQRIWRFPQYDLEGLLAQTKKLIEFFETLDLGEVNVVNNTTKQKRTVKTQFTYTFRASEDN